MVEIIHFPDQPRVAGEPSGTIAELIRFPLTPQTSAACPSNGPGHAAAFLAETFTREADPSRPVLCGFRADMFLVDNGQDVSFSLTYPTGKIGRAIVAAMLRRAAFVLDPYNHH